MRRAARIRLSFSATASPMTWERMPAGKSGIDGWWIDGFHTPGSYNAGGGPVSSMEYKAFNDGGGFPGAQICSGSGTVWTDVDGDVVWLLPDSCMVVPASVPATFWVAVAARMDFAAAGQWYVSTESVTTGNVAKWFNPGDGFGMGCTSWSSCDVTVVNAASLDMSYELLTFLLDPVDLQSLQVE